MKEVEDDHEGFGFFLFDDEIDVQRIEREYIKKTKKRHMKRQEETQTEKKHDKKQCQFINRVGMRCPEMIDVDDQTCERHRCTYVSLDRERCENVSDCKTKGYCKKHGSVCRCQYVMDGGILCNKTIYYGYFKNGVRYCEDHACVFYGCQNSIYQIL